MGAGNGPFFSIITVTRNSGEYIEQCIRSVVKQDFDDKEYIVIDGGSTDSTVDIIEAYSNHIAYWHTKPDRGIAHAFNMGLEQSKGRWIAFLNADDFYVAPDVLTCISRYLLAEPDLDVLFGQMIRVSRDSSPVPQEEPYGQPFIWSEFAKLDTIPHPAAFTSRTYFERFGGFDENYRIAMDYEMFMRAGRALKARFVPVSVAYMREGGLSRSLQLYSTREWLKVHKKHRILPNWYVNFLYSLYCIRIIAKRVIRSPLKNVDHPG